MSTWKALIYRMEKFKLRKERSKREASSAPGSSGSEESPRADVRPVHGVDGVCSAVRPPVVRAPHTSSSPMVTANATGPRIKPAGPKN